MSEGGEGQQPAREPQEHEPFRGAGEDSEVYRDRFDRMLAMADPGKRREVRRNEDGSKTAMVFLRMSDPREIVELREAAALAGVKETLLPLTLMDEADGSTSVHMGYEETIPKNALPGRLQDPPHSRAEDENTRETPL